MPRRAGYPAAQFIDHAGRGDADPADPKRGCRALRGHRPRLRFIRKRAHEVRRAFQRGLHERGLIIVEIGGNLRLFQDFSLVRHDPDLHLGPADINCQKFHTVLSPLKRFRFMIFQALVEFHFLRRLLQKLRMGDVAPHRLKEAGVVRTGADALVRRDA